MPTLRTESAAGGTIGLDEPRADLDQFEQRIDELEAAAADRLDELNDALKALADGELAGLRADIERLASGQTELVDALRNEDAELHAAVAAVAATIDELQGLAGRLPDESPALDPAALESLRARIDE